MMTYEHLVPLNHEDYSSHGVRIIHNTAISLAYISCVQTDRCRETYAFVETKSDLLSRCSRCYHLYELPNPATTYDPRGGSWGWGSPGFREWIADWLGVNYDDVSVSVV